MTNRPHPLAGAAALVLALGLLAFAAGCGSREQVGGENPELSDARERERVANVPKVPFTDVTELAGIRFVHTTGAFGRKLLPETMGSGVAFLDYDKDGKPDLLFVNSCHWPGHEEKGPAPTLALYRNAGDGKFEDVTKQAGMAVTLSTTTAPAPSFQRAWRCVASPASTGPPRRCRPE